MKASVLCVRRARWQLCAAAVLTVACSGRSARYVTPTGVLDPAPDADAVVYLVGDAGDDSPGRDAVLGHLSTELARVARTTPRTPVTVVFLGDNIYEVGARVDYRDEDLERLSAQVLALGPGPDVRGVFVPGNHDWGKGAGYDRAREAIGVQQRWIDEEAPPGVRVDLLPTGGCPGPASIDVGDDVHLVFIDTEWLLRLPEDGCGGVEAFHERLRADLEAHAGDRVIITAHHPMATGGPHGGNVGVFERGPFIYYLAVKSGLGVQDLASGRYTRMLTGLRSAIAASGTRPLVMATGHDHSLQVIGLGGEGEPAYQLVSGAGSKSSAAARIEGTRFAASRHGYMRLEFTDDETRLTVFAAAVDGPVTPVFGCRLEAAVGGEGPASAAPPGSDQAGAEARAEDVSCPEAPRAESGS